MSFSVNRAIVPLLLVLIVILTLPLTSSAELVDRVVAVVNSEVVTSTELEKSWDPIRRRKMGSPVAV